MPELNLNDNLKALEICVDTIESVETAFKAGADRIELCAALSEGGLTPSYAMIKKALEIAGESMKVNVLIRPRTGDFLYNDTEKKIMLDDIQVALSLGVNGIVTGALNADGSINEEFCREVTLLCKKANATFTFHRAFDVCANPQAELDRLISLGVDILLTSGCCLTAVAGIENIRNFQEQANNKLIILAASGINSSNAEKIIKETGVNQIHASARKDICSSMMFRRDINMGNDNVDEYCRKVADEVEIKKLHAILYSL